MRAHYFQHVPFEGLGSIESWLKAAGYDITVTRFFDAEQPPNLRDIDLLVVMGGPMSVNDERGYPWLAAEKKFIHEAIDSGKAVLGVCLGAQLIASALGARVCHNPVKEIGWLPITGIRSAGSSIFRFPESVDAFHWHGETFDLPPGATRIAESSNCENQAFQYGDAVIGMQFHLETTPESAKAMVTNCRAELIPSDTVQSEAEILAASSGRYREINRLMGEVLSFLVQPAGRNKASTGNRLASRALRN